MGRVFLAGSAEQSRVFGEIMATRGEREAKKALSFKKFLAHYKYSVSRRVIREQRILIDAFEARGVQDYIDICCPQLQDPIMPGLMRRLDGKGFYDPHPKTTQVSPLHPPLPGGFRLAKIRINHQGVNGKTEASVTGWQLVWSGDGVSDVEGNKRGKWKGAAMTVHELVIPKGDFVVGIEYIYEGPAILGVRVRMYFAGFTMARRQTWYGYFVCLPGDRTCP